MNGQPARSRAMLALAVSVVSGLVAAVLFVPPATATPAIATSTTATSAPAALTAARTTAAGISSVSVHDEDVTVRGSVQAADSDATVELYELGAETKSAPWYEHAPVAAGKATADGGFALTIPRYVGGRDRIYSAYQVAVRHASGPQAVGARHFADRLTFARPHSFPYPQTLSKKGLQVNMTDDAEELGVQHGALNLVLNDIMLKKQVDADNTISFKANGRTWFFARDKVEAFDHRLKPLSDNGELVTLILLLTNNGAANSPTDVMVHPDADFANGGPIFGFNTKTAEGTAYLEAAAEFIADRYTRPDGRFGDAANYIVGNEVDAQWVWSNSGEKSLDQFLQTYSRAVRIVWQATQKYWAGARTYISLTHCWTTVCGSNPDPVTPTRFYHGKDVVDHLNALTKQTGDFPWSIAYHPYPQDLSDPAFWKDTQAEPGFDTPQITFKNIEVLPRYLAQPEQTYRGQQRRIILSEQGCNTPGDSRAAEELQAACYAYAYYKVRFLDGIDSFILHRHVDHKQEGGLRLGLWTWDDQRPEGDPPGRHKYSYDVFRYIDTSRSQEVTDFAKKIIGIKDWRDVIPDFDPARLDQRPLPVPVGASVGAKPVHARTIADFSDGSDGWRAADNATGVQAQDGSLAVGFDAETKLWRGADVVLPRPMDTTRTPWLTLRVQVPKAAGLGDVAFAKVKAYSSGGRVAEATARLRPGAQWQTIAVDMSGWDHRDDVRRIKVWVRGEGNGQWKGSFGIDDVAVAKHAAPAGGATNIELAAKLLGGRGVGSVLQVNVVNDDASTLDGSLEVRVCDGVTLDPSSLDVSGLKPQQSRTVSATVTGFAPSNREHPVLCVRFHSVNYRVAVEMPPPVATPLYGFEDGTQGWTAGENVSEVAAVPSFPNGPTTPHGGSMALDATTSTGDASAPKTVSVRPQQPLDLSGATEAFAWVDSYGGAPGATGYEAVIRLWSGTDIVSATSTDYRPDRWNRVAVPVSDWGGRNMVTRIDVTFRALGTTASWNPHFQVDDVGFLD